MCYYPCHPEEVPLLAWIALEEMLMFNFLVLWQHLQLLFYQIYTPSQAISAPISSDFTDRCL